LAPIYQELAALHLSTGDFADDWGSELTITGPGSPSVLTNMLPSIVFGPSRQRTILL